MSFIDANRADFGVEPIITVLKSADVMIAPSGYYAAKTRPPSARSIRDAELTAVLTGLFDANFQVYGARKLWKAARRAGHQVGRDQVGRLMKAAGLRGVRRGRQVFTTKPDKADGRHPDLVKRDFTAAAPNQLWVTDLTYVPTWSGVAYVCFIVDAFSRMIVGWRVASNMRTELVLDALEMARWNRGASIPGLRCHSDAGAQFTSIRYGERLAEIGAVPSIGTVGDSFDNALAETVNGMYKTELMRGPARPGPWPDRRRRRTGHPGLGPLAQHQPPPQLPRRRPARRVRADVLRCATDRPTTGRNPIARASTRPSAIQPEPPEVSCRSHTGC